jgi:hypothetical protein
MPKAYTIAADLVQSLERLRRDEQAAKVADRL